MEKKCGDTPSATLRKYTPRQITGVSNFTTDTDQFKINEELLKEENITCNSELFVHSRAHESPLYLLLFIYTNCSNCHFI